MKRIGILISCILLLSQCSNSQTYNCVDELGCITIKPDEEIHLGVLQPLTGRLKNSGTVQIRGIKLALDEMNNELFGRKITLHIEDSQCSAEGGGNAALKLVSDQRIIGIIGTNCSGAAIEASKIVSQAGMVMISGTNSAASLTVEDGVQGADWNPGYFRTMYNSIGRGEVAAIYAYQELGITKAATVHDGDRRSIELVEKFEEVFAKLGGEVVISTSIDRQDQDMKPVLRRIEAQNAGFVFYPFFPPETVYFTKQAAEIPGLSNTVLMVVGSTNRSTDFINGVGAAGNDVLFLGQAPLSGSIFKNLENQYMTEYNDLQEGNLYAFAYDATNILLNAIKKIAVEYPDGTIHIPRSQLREAMYATKNHEGATGLLSSTEYGDCGTPQFNILVLKDYRQGFEGLMKNEVFTYIPEK